jgi:hypothetical protein
MTLSGNRVYSEAPLADGWTMKRDSVKQEGTTAAWLFALAVSEDATKSHARALLNKASLSKDPEVLRAAAADPRCPAVSLRRITDKLLSRVSKDPFALEVMIAVAWNPSTTLRTMEKISDSNHKDLRTVLCFNEATPASLLIALGDVATPDMGYHLACHPSSPSTLLETLSYHSDTSVRDAVLANPRTPKTTLNRLMGQVPDQIRLHAAARNPLTSPLSLAEWGSSSRYSVRRIVAANPNLPIYMMEQLAWAGDQRAQAAIASQLRIPESLARALASNLTSIETRVALAQNPNIPPHVVLSLLLDSSADVRAAVISAHKSLSTQSLVHLAYEDSAPAVHAALAGHPNLPTSPLIKLVDESAAGQYSSAVKAAHRDAKMETELAFTLHYHSDINARIALYHREDCPPEALTHAIQDSNPRIRASAAINPAITSEALTVLDNDPDFAVRLLASTHPSAS